MISVLLLLTEPMTSPLAWHSVDLAKSLLSQGAQVKVFFYQDAANIANRLNWRPGDEPNLAQQWLQLDLERVVCVSAALLRGVTDADNAARHHLRGENIAEGFHLVGLGDLADSLLQAERVVHL